jgi:hypothetical protein
LPCPAAHVFAIEQRPPTVFDEEGSVAVGFTVVETLAQNREIESTLRRIWSRSISVLLYKPNFFMDIGFLVVEIRWKVLKHKLSSL